MSLDHDDAGLREKFRLLKRQDQALAPEFARYWDALRRLPLTQHVWTLNYRFVSAAFALILLAGIAAGVWRKGFLKHPEPAEATIAQLSQWRAPTDSLLQTPGGELLRTLPRFGDQTISSAEMK